jgi:hypothetical protein
MAESTLSIAYADLRSETGQFLGWSRDSANWSTENRSTIIASILADGLRRFYVPPILQGERKAHEWSFLKPTISITTTAPYSTGTIAATAGVVTLSGGTWPTAAADGELIVAGVTYTVNTRNSGTGITLDDTSIEIDAGTAYEIVFPFVTLTDAFGGLLGPITFRPGSSACYGPLENVGEWMIRTRRQDSDLTSRPTMAAIRNRVISDTSTIGQRWEMLMWPIPDAAYELFAKIRIAPNTLSATHTYPYGGMPHARTIQEAVLSVAEERMIDTRGVHYAAFLESLQASVEYDRNLMAPEYLGIDRGAGGDGDSVLSSHELSHNYVTYEGHAMPY